MSPTHRPALFVVAIALCIVSNTSNAMNIFHRTDEFDDWLPALKDRIGRARIAQRIDSAAAGNFGDCGPVGDGVSETRVHVVPGYRIYFTRIGEIVYLLMVGGDKSSQKRDIKRALAMAHELKRTEQ